MSNKRVKCYEYKVQGMHCASCELTIERKVSKFSGVKYVDANLSTKTIKIKGFFDKSKEDIANEINKLLKNDGYVLSDFIQTNKKSLNFIEYIISLLLVLIFVFLYLILNSLNLNFVELSNLNYWSFFVIGFIASLSSCAALVGGIILSITSNDAKYEKSKRVIFIKQVIFHSSRLIAFFVFGGILGALGKILTTDIIVASVMSIIVLSYLNNYLSKKIRSKNIKTTILLHILVFTISILIFYQSINFLSFILNLSVNLVSQFVLNLIISLIMFLIALDLLELLVGVNWFKIHLPKNLLKFSISRSEKLNNYLSPILLGILTFFHPCGFTLTVQGFALNSMSFWHGATIMLFFALGTLPVLALISFFSINLNKNKKYSGIFLKVSGFLLIIFSIYNVITAFRVIGLM